MSLRVFIQQKCYLLPVLKLYIHDGLSFTFYNKTHSARKMQSENCLRVCYNYTLLKIISYNFVRIITPHYFISFNR